MRLNYSLKAAFCLAIITASMFSCKTPKAGFDEKHAITLDTMQITVPRDNPYRSAATIVYDLVHTKLEVNFDWQHQWMYGKAYVTIKPHFYPQTAVTFDAKFMDLYKVELVKADGSKAPLTFTYDTLQLTIKLDREYKADEKLTVFIDYKAKPNDHKSAGSTAIADDKGLYFINPLGTDSDKPREIWTQGETESNSNWFPTFDKPNFKCTDEIYMTVESKYTTLSNGLLISQKDNGNGTRTDYWKMDLPHSPYLFMMAVGEFVVTKDHWRDREVNYYMEPKYSPYARRLFGETPAMMEFYSTLLGVDYAWPKYAQVVGRDYVSGAMENTSATLHGDNLNRTARQALDEDYHDYVSHELFHQWFGDLVTCRSWSNVTVNESMADYGEYLWNDHRYGREYADWKNHQAFEKYMGESKRGKNVDLVRYKYEDREEVFDIHTYEKGGRILHMLRNMIGDDAFFKGLQLYLKTYQFKATEVSQLRESFEQFSGRDLNWFFNQWYFKDGHPILNFEYSYKNDSVYVKASQKHNTDTWLTYELPFAIDIHYGDKIDTHQVVLKKKSQTFAFKAKGTPDLIDADADRILLCEKSENKTTKEYVFQYRHAANYMQKREAIDSLRRHQKNAEAATVYRDALHDRSESVRALAARYIYIDSTNTNDIVPLLKIALEKDSASRVRAAAVELFGKLYSKEYIPEIVKAIGDSSYLVAATALTTLNKLDTAKALEMAKLFDKETVFDIKNAVYTINGFSGGPGYNSYFLRKIHTEKGFSRSFLLYHYANFLIRMSPEMCEAGIDSMKNILTSDTVSNKQFHDFGLGSIDRIKDHYERQKDVLEGQLKTADKKSKIVYDPIAVRAEIAKIDPIIERAKAAIDALKIGK